MISKIVFVIVALMTYATFRMVISLAGFFGLVCLFSVP